MVVKEELLSHCTLRRTQHPEGDQTRKDTGAGHSPRMLNNKAIKLVHSTDQVCSRRRVGQHARWAIVDELFSRMQRR